MQRDPAICDPSTSSCPAGTVGPDGTLNGGSDQSAGQGSDQTTESDQTSTPTDQATSLTDQSPSATDGGATQTSATHGETGTGTGTGTGTADAVAVGGASPQSCAPPAGCPENFCKPLPWVVAQAGRFDTFAPILAGISAVVGPRVVPLWNTFIWGGSDTVQDLSATFGQDFAGDPATSSASDFLLTALRNDLKATPPTFANDQNTRVIDIGAVGPQTTAALAALRDPSSPKRMEFTGNSIPGNLAGGIGANEAACRVGAIPSAQNDDRRASGTLTITNFPHIKTLLVQPSITFTVDDTIDFCPGNCGTGFFTVEVTTILSRWEATGISGDVPFTVTFPSSISQFSVEL